MLSSSTLKLISFELSKNLELKFYFEAALLAQAYQIFVHAQIPFTRLNEFWDEPSKKLLRFSELLNEFLAQHSLHLPDVTPLKKGVALKKTPLGLFLFNLLHLKHQSNLEAVSSVFTSPFIKTDLVKRHVLDAKIRRRVHAYVDLQTYVDKLDDFEAWMQFAAWILPVRARLSEWLQWLNKFLLLLDVQIPQDILRNLDAYFLPADVYLKPLPYQEFLEHFNMFLEDYWVMPPDIEFYGGEELLIANNPFISGRLIQEYQIELPRLLVKNFVAMPFAAVGIKPYRREDVRDVLRYPEHLNLREQAGGAAILSQQAACPFKAFGHFQLKLEPLVVQDAWLSGKLKGIAVHRILEKIWDQLKSQKALLSLNQDELLDLVNRTTQEVILGLSSRTQFFLPQSLACLEIRRLTQLLLAWLSQEKQRPEFKVHALEVQSLAYVGDLVIKLRLDRIDELADGQRVVLDYKTGSVNIKEWINEPLGDVQLPLYVLTTGAAGALFAEVNNHLHFSGIVAEDVSTFSEVKVAQHIAGQSWGDLKSFWQKHIEALAQAISQGVASVQPEPQACEYCDLHAVCRIKELNTYHGVSDA